MILIYQELEYEHRIQEAMAEKQNGEQEITVESSKRDMASRLGHETANVEDEEKEAEDMEDLSGNQEIVVKNTRCEDAMEEGVEAINVEDEEEEVDSAEKETSKMNEREVQEAMARKMNGEQKTTVESSKRNTAWRLSRETANVKDEEEETEDIGGSERRPRNNGRKHYM